MSNLSRAKRRSQILDAAIDVAGVEGFRGVSVRRITAKLDCSASNIHHIFSSVAELKREAFKRFTANHLSEAVMTLERLPLENQLHWYLNRCALNRNDKVSMIWNSAAQESSVDIDFSAVFVEAYRGWIENVAGLLMQMRPALDCAAAELAAERLVSICTGISMFASTATADINIKDMERHLEFVLAGELEAVTCRTTPASALNDRHDSVSAVLSDSARRTAIRRRPL